MVNSNQETVRVFSLLFFCSLLYSHVSGALVSRASWGAKNPKNTYTLQTPVSTVIVLHTQDWEDECWSQQYCKLRVRKYQDHDMDDLGWTDIRYNFLVGRDGNSYEGRGWNRIGYHTNVNAVNRGSISIALIGDFNSKQPSTGMMSTLKDLIKTGVTEGAISPTCEIQVREEVDTTYCQQNKLYNATNALGNCAGIGVTAPGPQPSGDCPDITSRAEWSARNPKSVTSLTTPVGHVIIHHTAGPACSSQTACKSRVRSIQDYHMDTNGWSDIGYNFLIGGDGEIYEGRGWDRVGAHTAGINSQSIGICFIGTFTSGSPTAAARSQAQSLIDCGLKEGKIKATYQLRGHRRAGSTATACPGNTLYNLITSWDNFHSTRYP